VISATASGVASFNTRIGAVVLNSTDVTTALTYTPYNATNPSGYQTAAQVTAVLPVASSTTPVMDGTATIGVGTSWARADHVHPVDTSRYAAANPSGYQTAANVTTALAAGQPGAFSTLSASGGVSGAGFTALLTPYALLASPTFTGTPTLPTGTIATTQTAGNSSTAVATTAFVATSFAPIAAPVFTGDARAVTAAVGDNDTSIATTAFVQSAVGPAFSDVGSNKLHNTLFNISQRTGPWTVQGYTLDRWVLSLTTDTVSISQAVLADADRTALADEAATFALQNVFTGNVATGAYNFISQRIENLRRLSGKTHHRLILGKGERWHAQARRIGGSVFRHRRLALRASERQWHGCYHQHYMDTVRCHIGGGERDR
jgi:hypothetical protein